jgi:hypothetical protein
MKSLINEYLVLYHSALQLSKKSSNMARHWIKFTNGSDKQDISSRGKEGE